MKFKFRLQTLWKLRVVERDERQRRLSEAHQAEDVLRARAVEIDAELAASEQALRAASQPGAINVDQLLDSQRYELLLSARRADLRTQQGRLAAEIERRRQALVEADRDVKVLEKLREKRLDEHRRVEARLEIKRLDEVGQNRPRQEHPT